MTSQPILENFAEVGKAQLEAKSAISATSAITEVELHFNFFILKHCESCVAVFSKSLKLLRFNCATFSKKFAVNSAILYIELGFVPFRTVDKHRLFLANYLLFFCLKPQKTRYLHWVVKF